MLDPDVGGKSVSGLASSFLDQTGIADQCHIGGERRGQCGDGDLGSDAGGFTRGERQFRPHVER